jgi:hypothetical protein
MSDRNFDLVLKCVVLATELLKFGNELVVLLNTVLNYLCRNAPQMVLQVPAQAWSMGFRPDK